MEEKKAIKSVSNNQFEIINNILKLHNGNNPIECDITYSTGGFYGKHGDILIEEPKYKFDIAPMNNDIIQINPWGKIPLTDESISSLMFDPPFVISPRNSPSIVKDNDNKRSCVMIKRFSSYYPYGELLDSYLHFFKEAKRLLKNDGIFIVKTQPCVTARKELNSHHYLWFIGESLGFDLIDEFVLITNRRLISGKIKSQEHARKFHSYFYVFKKSQKQKPKYLDFCSDVEKDELLTGFNRNNSNPNSNTCNKKWRENIIEQHKTMNLR